MNRKLTLFLALAAALLGIYYIVFDNKMEVGMLLLVLSRLDYLRLKIEEKE